MKQVYQRLSKYRSQNEDDKGGSAISRIMMATAQMNSQTTVNSPSPTTILKTVNNSGSFMCAPAPSKNGLQNSVLTYHEATATSRIHQQIESQQMHNLENLDETITVNMYSSNDMAQQQFVGYRIMDDYEQEEANKLTSSYETNKEEDTWNIGMSNSFSHENNESL